MKEKVKQQIRKALSEGKPVVFISSGGLVRVKSKNAVVIKRKEMRR